MTDRYLYLCIVGIIIWRGIIGDDAQAACMGTRSRMRFVGDPHLDLP